MDMNKKGNNTNESKLNAKINRIVNESIKKILKNKQCIQLQEN